MTVHFVDKPVREITTHFVQINIHKKGYPSSETLRPQPLKQNKKEQKNG